MRKVWPTLSSKISKLLQHERFFVVCLGVAFLVRLVWILSVDAQPISDFVWYFSKGLQIAAGQGYVITDDGFPLWKPGAPLPVPQPTAFWPVGYPAFLGVLFYCTSWLVEPLFAAKLANVFLYLGVIVAVSYCTRVIFDSVVAGRLAALLLTFLPNHIAYTALTSVEIYFAFLTTAGTALLLRAASIDSRRLVFLAGLVFGLGSLTKPQALLLPALLLVVLGRGVWRRLPAYGALAYAGVLLVLLPWAYRNYEVFGRPVLVSTNGGINLLIGNMPGSWTAGDMMWNPELDRIINTLKNESERDAAAGRVALDYIVSHPWQVAATLPEKLESTYSGDVDGFGWNQVATPALTDRAFWKPLRIYSQLYYMFVLGFAVWSLWRFRARLLTQPSFRVGPAIFVYFTSTYLVFFGGARFHFPVVPWFGAYAAGLLVSLLEAPEPRAEAAPAPLPPANA